MSTIQLRRGTAASWTSANPTLAAGEPGFETDTGRFKIGDGSTAWNSLAYQVPSTGAAGQWTVVTKTSDESVASSTVLQNDDELFFTAASGKLYFIEAHIFYGSPAGAGTPDMRVAFGEDNSTVRGLLRVLCLSNTDAPSDTAGQTNQATNWVAGTAAANRGLFAVGYHVGNGGTFRYLWAQNTSGVNATIVRAGSIIRYQQIV